MSDFPDKCTICSMPVSDDEEQFTFGWLGVMPVAFCVWCFSGLHGFFNPQEDDNAQDYGITGGSIMDWYISCNVFIRRLYEM